MTHPSVYYKLYCTVYKYTVHCTGVYEYYQLYCTLYKYTVQVYVTAINCTVETTVLYPCVPITVESLLIGKMNNVHRKDEEYKEYKEYKEYTEYKKYEDNQ